MVLVYRSGRQEVCPIAFMASLRPAPLPTTDSVLIWRVSPNNAGYSENLYFTLVKTPKSSTRVVQEDFSIFTKELFPGFFPHFHRCYKHEQNPECALTGEFKKKKKKSKKWNAEGVQGSVKAVKVPCVLLQTSRRMFSSKHEPVTQRTVQTPQYIKSAMKKNIDIFGRVSVDKISLKKNKKKTLALRYQFWILKCGTSFVSSAAVACEAATGRSRAGSVTSLHITGPAPVVFSSSGSDSCRPTTQCMCV